MYNRFISNDGLTSANGTLFVKNMRSSIYLFTSGCINVSSFWNLLFTTSSTGENTSSRLPSSEWLCISADTRVKNSLTCLLSTIKEQNVGDLMLQQLLSHYMQIKSKGYGRESYKNNFSTSSAKIHSAENTMLILITYFAVL